MIKNGAVCRTLHRMLPRAGVDGVLVTGFMPQLQDLLGEGSFDAGAENTRYAALLRSPSRLAAAFGGSWRGLQEELPDRPGVLSHGAQAAGRDTANVQRELTGLREAARFSMLDTPFGPYLLMICAGQRGSTLTGSVPRGSRHGPRPTVESPMLSSRRLLRAISGCRAQRAHH